MDWVAWAFVFNIIYLLISKCIIFFSVCKNSNVIFCKRKIFKVRKYSKLSLLSVDFLISDHLKKCFENIELRNTYIVKYSPKRFKGFTEEKFLKFKLRGKKKKMRMYLIKCFNIVNLYFSVILFIFFPKLDLKSENNIYLILFYFLIIRIIWRSIEIILAFGMDVTSSKKKNSSLKSNDRICLVIKSYIEVVLLNATLYKVLLNLSGRFESFIYSFGITSFGAVKFIELDLVSRRVVSGLFNENFNNVKKFYKQDIFTYYLGNTIISLQLLTTICLIVLSFAIYTGYKDNKKRRKWKNA